MDGMDAVVETAAQLTDHAPLLERLFEIEPVEGAYEIDGIEGEVPAYLRGNYYVNGPGRLHNGELAYRHWLDGDGLVCHLRFGAGGVRFNSRFVASTKRGDELAAGRALYRTFGTAWEDDQLKRGIALESPVNVSVYPFKDTLLAFGEQGLPWELDPETLETRGEYTFDGRLNAISPLSAHPCFDQSTGEMFNFGISFSLRQPCLHLYRLQVDGELIYRRRVALEQPCSVHDFGLSPSYAIFYLSPYVLDVEAVMKRGASIMEALSWIPEGDDSDRQSELVILSRDSGQIEARIPIGSKFCLHQINAFEEDGRLHVDVMELDRPIYDQYQTLPDLFVDAPPGRPLRMTVDTSDWQIVERRHLSYDSCPDFPAMDPRQAQGPYDDFWLLGISATGRPGRKFFDQVAHLKWSDDQADVYQAPPHHYLGGEPVFAPDPTAPGRGAILCQCFDAERRKSSFLIFDAQQVAAGPIARLPLRNPVPSLFHATFEPAGG